MTERIKSATLNLRIDPKIKKMAEKDANDDHRSLTSFIEKLILDHHNAKALKS